MAIVQVDFLQCDSCKKRIIETDSIAAKWIVIQGLASIYFIDKKGDVKNKPLGHYCSKKCFYDLVREENDKVDETPTVVDSDGLLELNAYPEHTTGKIQHLDTAEEF